MSISRPLRHFHVRQGVQAVPPPVLPLPNSLSAPPGHLAPQRMAAVVPPTSITPTLQYYSHVSFISPRTLLKYKNKS